MSGATSVEPAPTSEPLWAIALDVTPPLTASAPRVTATILLRFNVVIPFHLVGGLTRSRGWEACPGGERSAVAELFSACFIFVNGRGAAGSCPHIVAIVSASHGTASLRARKRIRLKRID